MQISSACTLAKLAAFCNYRNFMQCVILRFFALALCILPLKAFCQIGTNPQDTYGGVQPGTNQTKPAVKGDSGDVKHVHYSTNVKQISADDLQGDSLRYHALDTTLRNFENYSNLYQPGRYYINLGNYGLAAKPLLPSFHSATGFNNGQNIYDVYLLHPEDITYYRNKSPYTNTFYITGKGQKTGLSEGIFNFVHARNINPRLNIGIEYNRSGSNGYYPRQTSDVLNVAAFLWYQSANLRYNLITNFIVNTIDGDENGGLTNDNIFKVKTSTTHPFDTVYLNQAHSKWSDYGFYARQYYLIGRIDSARDTVSGYMKVYPTARAYYSFHYKAAVYEYNDNFNTTPGQGATTPGLTPLYYPSILLDTLATNDRTHQSTMENEIGLAFFGHGNLERDKHFSTSGLRLDASIKDQYIRYTQNTIDSTIHNVLIHAIAGYDLSNRFSLQAIGDYVLLGPNHYDNYLAASSFLNFSKEVGTLSFNASIQNNSPDLVYNRWTSNSYIWNFHFQKTRTRSISASYINQFLKLKGTAELQQITGYMYFAGIANQVVFPEQYVQPIKFFRATLAKDVRLGHTGFEMQAVYQHNSAPFIIRTPDFYTTASIYYENLYFKVLNVKGGVDATYFTHAYAYDYAPGLQQFFVYTNQKIGDYPVGDVFLVAGLKRTSFILRYDYFNQGFSRSGYYTVHHYPMPDHLLKFGLSWKFYD